MKSLIIIPIIFSAVTVTAQTTPAPPYYPTASPAYNIPAQNNGTPMVKNPVENNNPSVQASIPILNKPNALEVDRGGYVAQSNRIIYNNVQQNTTVKNVATEGNANVPTAVAASSVSSDTMMRATAPVSVAVPTTAPVVSTTVIYNNTTGTDLSGNADKTTLITARSSSNTTPVRQTYISEKVVNRFKAVYGDNLYDIRQVRYGTNNSMYVIRTMKEGFFSTMYLDENGEVVQQ